LSLVNNRRYPEVMSIEQTFEVRLRLEELPDEIEDLLVAELGGIVSRFAGVPYVTLLQAAPNGRKAALRLVQVWWNWVAKSDPSISTMSPEARSQSGWGRRGRP